MIMKIMINSTGVRRFGNTTSEEVIHATMQHSTGNTHVNYTTSNDDGK